MSTCDVFARRMEEQFGTRHPVAFITGSTKPRVGRGVADMLAQCGFRIVLHGHTRPADEPPPSDLLAGCPPELVVYGDVAEEQLVRHWLQQIDEQCGRIDLVVHTAAIWQPCPLERLQAADYEKMFRVNALSTALICQHFGLRMSDQPTGGAIVTIGDWAVRRPYRDFAAYFTSKGAVPTITQSMAVELALRNPRVRVNAILPGPVKLSDSLPAERRQAIVEESLLKRVGSPDDVAWAVLFLALSPFVTGVCLPVDGGRSIYAGPAADPVAHPDVAGPD
ncbi:MAG: oxidoreductase [Pirellulaceae bacterium]|nr:MAG: oxidoreductase [Pirellulaceae bacterium]